jgi:hypothetical protein
MPRTRLANNLPLFSMANGTQEQTLSDAMDLLSS